MRTRPKGGKTEEKSGFGDLTLRLKVNAWGNDGGKTAFGIISFLKLPTNQNNLGNNAIEGGVIFPLAIELSDKWDVGIVTRFDFNKNEADSGYNAGFVNSISFGYGINSQWSTYFELYTAKTTEFGSQFIATFDTGIKYLVTENLQLDAGINIGLTRAADDLQPFVGISVRF
ncbi:MAG: transporter [Leptolyngbyaceae cyanobacterium bins.302]|nr:transporter [Leptolyngbyaceae cyanobacterium bins.302]